MKRICVCLILIAMAAALVSCTKTNYAQTIAHNWDLVLPSSCEQVYGVSSDPGFHGDGERYHVFSCSDAEAMSTLLKWSETVIKDTNFLFNVVMELDIDESYLIKPGGYWRYAKSHQDGSKLIVLYSPEQQLLYVLEDFH
jgi:lipoprotein